jgi:hypothetical protein
VKKLAIIIVATTALGACSDSTKPKTNVTATVCNNGDLRCNNTKDIEQCSNGTFVPDKTCVGACIQTSPTVAACEATTPAPGTTPGTGTDTTACTKPGAKSCQGNALMVCTNKVWTNNATCASGCVDHGAGSAECTTPCTLDQERCNGTRVEGCAPDATGKPAWKPLGDCGPNFTCAAVTNVKARCDFCKGVANQGTVCVGTAIVQCDAEGNAGLVGDCSQLSSTCYNYGEAAGANCLAKAGGPCAYDGDGDGQLDTAMACADANGKPDLKQACQVTGGAPKCVTLTNDPAKNPCQSVADAQNRKFACDTATNSIIQCYAVGPVPVALVVQACGPKALCTIDPTDGPNCSTKCTNGTDVDQCDSSAQSIMTCGADGTWATLKACQGGCLVDNDTPVCLEDDLHLPSCNVDTDNVCDYANRYLIACDSTEVAGATDCTAIDPSASCGHFGGALGYDCMVGKGGTCLVQGMFGGADIYGCGHDGELDSLLGCDLVSGTCITMTHSACSGTDEFPPACAGNTLVEVCKHRGRTSYPIVVDCASTDTFGTDPAPTCADDHCVASEGGYCEPAPAEGEASLFQCGTGLKCETGSDGSSHCVPDAPAPQ